MRRPVSTYRLQIRPAFDLDEAAGVVGYLRDLGVDWAYLSPILQAADGSEHGYDVVDPSRVDQARGGAAGLERFAAAARGAGLGILVDIVPNHLGVDSADQNAWWRDVLAHGRESRFAEAFDVDWDAGDGHLRLPEADGGLNYRRFFTVSSLAGVRVEVPWVFDAMHVEVGRWFREGIVDGLRIDHPDGLLDPEGYLHRLERLTDAAYVVVEKILGHAATDDPERLPSWWDTDGTTGYDALAEIDRVLVDPAGEARLDRLEAALRAAAGLPPGPPWADLCHDAKRAVAETSQAAEVARLVRALPVPIPDAGDALAELLACFPVYRSYPPAGREHLERAAAEASRRRPDLAGAIGALTPLLADATTDVAQRFPQTTAPVMAKGVEDAGFYRFTRLGTLTEVGGDPSVFALSVAGLHRAFAERQSAWPHTMTALSTHDTKRSEDVRARLAVLAEVSADELGRVFGGCVAQGSTGHPPLDLLICQAAIGAWPIARERLHPYAVKAAREAGERTSWAEPDAAFEARVAAFVDAIFDDAVLHDLVAGTAQSLAPHGWSNSLSAKLLQLTGPGVPDVYQGTELWDHSLVDPDNRRPVDIDLRRRMLADLDAASGRGELPPVDETGAAKLLVTSRALRLRRDRPELFSRYTPMTVVGEAAAHAVAFDRGGAVSVVTRLPLGLAARGGWGDTVLLRHGGPTVDVLTRRSFPSSRVRLADLLSVYPVALLAIEEGA